MSIALSNYTRNSCEEVQGGEMQDGEVQDGTAVSSVITKGDGPIFFTPLKIILMACKKS